MTDPMEDPQTKYAVVRGRDITGDKIAAYLPAAYEVVAAGERAVLIAGHDVFGWTLDGYVIPRLASGLWFAEEFESKNDSSTIDFGLLEREAV